MTSGTFDNGLPHLHRRLCDLGALTTDDLSALAERLAIATLADLQFALDDGRIARTFEAATQANLAAAAATIASEARPLTLGRATDILETLQGQLRLAYPLLGDVTRAGDARRYEPLVDALVVVASATDPPAAVEAICQAPWAEAVPFRTGRRALVVVQHAEVDIRVAAPDEYGTVLFMATGPAQHVRAVCGPRGMRAVASQEQDLYAQAGLPWIPPELRQGSGEIEAARRARCRHSCNAPTSAAISTCTRPTATGGTRSRRWSRPPPRSATSTSRSPITRSTPARRAPSRSTRRAAAGRDRAAARDVSRHEILHGIEVDILPDGHLDFPDDGPRGARHRAGVAARRGAATTPRELTEAMPRARSVIRSSTSSRIPPISSSAAAPGYDMDYDAIYAAAAETGTALEIDGAPSHLDLDGEHARGGGRGRRHRDHRQRLPPRQGARPPDATSGSAPPVAAGSSPATSSIPARLRDVRAFIAAQARTLTA